jgi:RND family efflux transporter MFP subunit
MIVGRRNTRGWIGRAAGAAVALGLVGIGSAGCAPPDGGAAQAEQVDTARTAPEGARVVNVEATPVTLSSFVDFVRTTGEIEALYDVTVSAEESGAIARFLVAKGSTVRRGQVIAKIDDAVLVAQVNEARALAEIAQEQYERQRRLWEEEQIGSEIAYLQAQSSAEAATARLRTLEARLARTEVRAPVAGVFDEQFVELGEMVAPGTPVVRVVTVRQVKVVGGIPERFALDVGVGSSATVTLDALQGRRFDGSVAFLGTSVDPQSRTLPIEIVLDNPSGIIKPRMLANVQVQRTQLDSVVVVPQDVVRRAEEGYEVFVVVENEGRLEAEARAVLLGPGYANQVVVDSGLAVGDRLITVGHGLVDDGSLVRVVAGAARGPEEG